MARIELRDAIIRIKDGLSGTGLINEPSTAPVTTDTEFDIDGLSLNTAVTDQVPVGARFTVAGETDPTAEHTVTARTPTTGTTTNITFTPALGAGTYVDGGTVTFLPQQIEVKVGDGNLTWTINKEYEYLLDRGNLDTVREGDQQPLDVTLDSVYEQITTGTSETITPYDAMNGVGGAAEWVSSSSDACEPYAVDIEVEHSQPCGTAQDEITLLPDFRYDTLEVDIDAATLSFTGRCNTVSPTVTRQ
jgi:hypothetical protein